MASKAERPEIRRVVGTSLGLRDNVVHLITRAAAFGTTTAVPVENNLADMLPVVRVLGNDERHRDEMAKRLYKEKGYRMNGCDAS